MWVLSDCYFLSIIFKTKEEWKDIHDIKPLLLAHYIIQECFAQTPDSKAKEINLTLSKRFPWHLFLLNLETQSIFYSLSKSTAYRQLRSEYQGTCPEFPLSHQTHQQ